MLAFERSLLPGTRDLFDFDGHCYVCNEAVSFRVSFDHVQTLDGVATPIWRETVNCPSCHFNNRMRAAVHVFELECNPGHDSKIYITEQTTPKYDWYRKNYADVSGSEHLGQSIPLGGQNDKGIRNEDITKLTFPDAEFDFILSFDVFEHIPDYASALENCFRCLKPDGTLFFSVPFVKQARRNIVRAVVENGEVRHLLPPEYHGDPLSSEGCLCYYHFGWELLDVLRSIGFEDVTALMFSSADHGYLGGEQIMFKASRL